MKCFECEGTGELIDYIDYQVANRYDCFECAGKGEFSFWHYIVTMFWRNAPTWFVEKYIDLYFVLKENNDEPK